ncbi:unnamed protein product, partial [Mesorhabditis belari]|uniref:Transmembrane protein family 132 middle domain-containing protein n=1 Tax=Mesorhabditis belari TaxID=2138241 RepID=A0AAF3J1Q8_9BILA
MRLSLPFTLIFTIIQCFSLCKAQHFSVQPPQNAFFLFSPVAANSTENRLYLHDDCPADSEQFVSIAYGGQKTPTKLQSTLHNVNCAVTVRVVQDTIRLDRPFIDVVAQSDGASLSSLRRRLCVSVRVSSPSGGTVTAHCELSPFEESRHSCLVRIQVPFSWFGLIGINATKQILSLSHVTATHCDALFFDRPQVPITLIPFVETAQAHILHKENGMELSLLSRSNLSFSLNSLNALFVHLSYNLTNEKNKELEEIELKAWLDSRFEVVNAASLSPSSWTVRPLTAARPGTYVSFICTRVNRNSSFDGHLLALLLKLRGVVINDPARHSESVLDGDNASLHWEVRRKIRSETATNISRIDAHRVATPFRVAPDSVYSIVAITKSNSLINVAVLSATQYSLPMRIISVTLGGSTRDVTALSHCISSEVKVLKTSPTCSSVYVDGSELRGMPAARVHVHYEQWTTQVAFTVWFPRLPVTIWLSNPVLHGITNWPVAVWKQLESAGAARQFGCTERFQHSEIKVLASFQVGDERTGERLYLAGRREMLFDVTTLAASRVHSVERSVAVIKIVDGRLLAYAQDKGTSRIVLKSSAPQIDYGSSVLTVSPKKVTIVKLSAMPIVAIEPRVIPISGQPGQYFVQTNIQTAFTHKYQHGSLSLFMLYSDEQMESLLDVPLNEYSLAVHSTEEHSLAIAHRQTSSVDMIALDDITDASVRILVRPPAQCRDPDGNALAETEIPIGLTFSVDSHRNSGIYTSNTTMPTTTPSHTSPWRVDTVAAIVIITLLLVLLCRLVSRRARAFNGYEKLVVPLLSRLSSSSSGGRDAEETKEWVWIGRPTNRQFTYRHDIPSAASSSEGDFSAKGQPIHSFSRRTALSSTSFDEPIPSNKSYRGSEISVFISPQPSVSVHANSIDGGSWRQERITMTRNLLHDSTSETNVNTGYEWGTRRSAGEWTPASRSWGNRRRATDYEGLRETVA